MLDRVRFGLVRHQRRHRLLTVEKDADAIDFTHFAIDACIGWARCRSVRRIRWSRRVGRVTGRPMALASVTDAWESDIMVADGLR